MTTSPVTMRTIREANPLWFAPSAMRFFESRVSPRVYGAGYFVTSERGPDGVRRYSVRRAGTDRSAVAPVGIETVGEFGGYATGDAAHRAARRLAGQVTA